MDETNTVTPPPGGADGGGGSAGNGDGATQATAEPQLHRLEFTGTGAEYFRIWIVNLALTVVTLGIYSAWAKVRKLHYFYGSTVLAGSAFGYHGEPLKILKGRAIATVFVAAYFVLGRIAPAAGGLAAVVLTVALPWLVVKSRLFTLRMTSWRGLRFDFRPDYAGAYAAFLGWALLAGITLGILFPRFTYERYKFVVTRARLGATEFGFGARIWPFYKAALGAGAVFIVGVVLAGVAMAMVIAGTKGTAAAIGRGPADLGLLGAVVLYVIALLIATAVLQAGNLNETYGRTTLGPHRLHCELRAGKLARLYLGNALGIVLTLGLFTPWAQLRMAKYRIEALTLEARGSLDEFAAGAAAQQTAATGEEISSLFDVDFGF